MRRAVPVVLVVALLALTACTGGAATPAASSSPTTSIQDVITAAAATSTSGPYHSTESRKIVGESLTVTADFMDALDRVAYVWDQPEEPAFIAIGQDFYFRTDPSVAQPWLHLDRARLGDQSQLPGLLLNVGSAIMLLDGITKVESSGPDRYTGVIDLIKTGGEHPSMKERRYLSKFNLGVAGGSREITFTLALRDGRVESMHVEAGKVVIDATFSYAADPLVVAPPADQIREATTEDYQLW